ncbi:MAG TPA: formate dehydrogenase accessory protein FdhE [Gemmatimonadales bacterium]|nr:formate dehydrogenase accessory protein FdhE [Gemmatimonadales bacterium]
MLWPNARTRRPRNVELQGRVAAARRDNPEAQPWLGLLEAALAESEAGSVWDAAVPPVLPPPAADRPVKAPLLSHAPIAVHGRAARGWVRRVLTLALPAKARRIDGLALLEAAVCHDDARVDALAEGAGAEPHAVRVVAQMAALPLLQACGRGLAGAVPATWWEGYCPVCGTWPVLAEYTGLERKRQLRCGRCGTGWALPALRCVFCDETRHDKLGYLTPEAGDQTHKIEVCHTCKGYLKGFTTVRSLAPWAILLNDLTTVPLDVAALERGYRRPERTGYALRAEVLEDGGGWWKWWRPFRKNLHQPPPTSPNLHQPAAGDGA